MGATSAIACPSCGKGNKGMGQLPKYCTHCGVDMQTEWLKKNMPVMPKKCSHCEHTFTGEPPLDLIPEGTFCPGCGGLLVVLSVGEVKLLQIKNPWTEKWR